MNDSMYCPNCGGEAEVPTVDIGVGEQQCGPARCEACGWEQEFPYIDDDFPEHGELAGDYDE